MRYLHAIVLFLCCISISVVAQDEGSEMLFERFEQRFQELDTLIMTTKADAQTPSLFEDSTTYMQHWLICQRHTHDIDSLVDNRIHAELREMKQATGLALTGQTYYRLDDNLAIDEDDAVSRYQAKIQVELRWNFLSSALIKRKGRMQEIQLRGNMDRISMDKVNIATLVADHQDFYRQKYDSLLAGILQHRLYNLSLMNDALMYLLENGNISSDDMLDIINSKAEAERALMAIAESYPYADNLNNPTGLIIEVDSTGLLQYVKEHHPDLHMLQLQSEILVQQMHNETYWRKLNISPFVRYSYYFRQLLPNSTNVDLGINFNIPISGESSKKRAAINAERAIVDKEYEQVQQKIAENIRNILLDIQRLNRTSAAELQRLQDLQKYLHIRSDAYLNRKGGYNIILRAKEYNTYLLCWEKFLSYQYQRDCLLMTLQTYLPNISVFDFCIGKVIE